MLVYRLLQRFTAKNLSHDENVSTVLAVGHSFVILFFIKLTISIEGFERGS